MSARIPAKLGCTPSHVIAEITVLAPGVAAKTSEARTMPAVP
ncbi:hypothetical protein R3Q08_29880 [Rhodococcus erythropolis]|nr:MULTISPECIES: hypothetical protein [Rhodococcus]MDV6212478.1 hypothetical protein [Rhodococcus erythropolis]MDV8011897.1 hypothetical protein [Rhodococcus sp. IEGM 1241]